ncbi:hypothetical protein [Brachybacterium sp. J153]|uniref:hypothetical protein n=1 Tax=Brachybacterium sp. J153 TaxID=3116488 RepID=UPI002E783B3B|nr:hypothetical protein [Brachybacterium sp. J153]MEE1619275.1 hypothetical protein [Brachybacterium sp. J153]
MLELDQNLCVPRSGRGTRLGQAQRREVWAIVEATWEFNGADAVIALRLRAAAGWVPEVGV